MSSNDQYSWKCDQGKIVKVRTASKVNSSTKNPKSLFTVWHGLSGKCFFSCSSNLLLKKHKSIIQAE